MGRVLSLFFLVGFIMSRYPSPARGELVVNSWSLLCGASDSSGQQGSYFTNVENPFENHHTLMYNNSTSSASYDFGWTSNSAHFDVATNHYLEQLRGFTVSEGRIHLVPAVDSTIAFSGTWHYSWPGATIGASDLSLDVYDLTADEDLVRAAGQGGNVGIGAPFGTFNLQNNGSLLAGREYEVFYFARISLFTDLPPGTHGEGSGEIHFSLTPVPEPAALSLTAIPLLFARRKPSLR